MQTSPLGITSPSEKFSSLMLKTHPYLKSGSLQFLLQSMVLTRTKGSTGYLRSSSLCISLGLTVHIKVCSHFTNPAGISGHKTTLSFMSWELSIHAIFIKQNMEELIWYSWAHTELIYNQPRDISVQFRILNNCFSVFHHTLMHIFFSPLLLTCAPLSSFLSVLIIIASLLSSLWAAFAQKAKEKKK